MTAKIIPFTGITTLDLDPEVVLENLKEKFAGGGLVYAGYDAEGNEVFGSTYADGGTALWLLERCKKSLLETGG
jgi:hypothetical protein